MHIAGRFRLDRATPIRSGQTALAILLLAAMSSTPAAEGQTGRLVHSLDGEWAFGLDPDRTGEAQGYWRRDNARRGRISVPGGWDAQGYGAETPVFRTSHEGVAWYTRTESISADWRGRRLFLCFDSVFRYARVWVNDTCVGGHTGYQSPFEFDITDVAPAGTAAHIAVPASSRAPGPSGPS